MIFKEYWLKAILHLSTNILSWSQRTLLERLRCFELALPAVQCSQIPEGGGDSRAVHFGRLMPTTILAIWRVVFPAFTVIFQRWFGTRPEFPLVGSGEHLEPKKKKRFWKSLSKCAILWCRVTDMEWKFIEDGNKTQTRAGEIDHFPIYQLMGNITTNFQTPSVKMFLVWHWVKMLMSAPNTPCGTEIVVSSPFSNLVSKVSLFNLGTSLPHEVFENDYDFKIP